MSEPAYSTASSPPSRADHPRLLASAAWGLAALTAAVFFFHLGSYGLWEPDEARYAEIAREMLATRDFILPHLDYVAYVEKPPLLYWLTALSFRGLGETEFAARLVSAISALVGVLATWFFAVRVFDRRRGLLAGAILATCPLYAVMAQVLTTDMLLTSLVTVALFAFFLSWKENRTWRWLFYAAMGLGTLAKGPVAIVIPGLVALVFLTWEGDLRRAVGRFTPMRGSFLTLAIAAPWFIAVAIREPDFVRFYFYREHILRFLEPSFSHGEPFYYYVPVVALGLLPWFILFALGPTRSTADREGRDFCVIASAVIFAFFSAASAKLIPYILPAFPPLAVLIADSLLSSEPRGEEVDAVAPVARQRSFTIDAPIVLGLIGGTMIAIAIAAPRIADPYLHLARPSLLACGAILVLGAAISSVLFIEQRSGLGLAAVVLAMAGAIAAGSYGRLAADPLHSYAVLSREVAARAHDAALICYHRYVQALPFYCRSRVVLVGPPSELRFGMEHSPDASRYFLRTDAELLRLWNAPGSKVLVIDERDLARLHLELGNYRVIASTAQKRAILRQDEELAGY